MPTGVGSGDNAGKLARLGRRHGLHLLVSLEICRCQVPRGGTRYQRRWRSTNRTFTFPDGLTEPVTVSGGGGSVAAGMITGDFLLRLPLDDFWPGRSPGTVHLRGFRWYFAR